MRLRCCGYLMTMATLAVVILHGMPSAAQETESRTDPLTGESTAMRGTHDTATEPENTTRRADLVEANELVRAGDYARAELVLAEQQEDFPDDARLLLMHGEVLLALAQPARALPLLRRSSELDGKSPRVHFQLAQAMLGTGDRTGALEAFAREIEINEDEQVHAMVHVNRKVLLEQDGNLVGAARELEALLELDPEKVAAFGNPGTFCGEMASLYIEAGELPEAAKSLERGLELGFRSADHWQSLGARHAQSEAWVSAIASFQKALEIDPALPNVERSLAAAFDQTGQTQEAVVHLRRYLELKPDASDAERVNQRIREIEGS